MNDYKTTRFDIEDIDGVNAGGFYNGYMESVSRIIYKIRHIISAFYYGYQTTDKLNECISYLNKLKVLVKQHNGNSNCNEVERIKSLELIEYFKEEIEGYKKKWEIQEKQQTPEIKLATLEFELEFLTSIIEKHLSVGYEKLSCEQQREIEIMEAAELRYKEMLEIEKEKHTKQPPQLEISLTDQERKLIFDLLIKKELIKADWESFNYAFGGMQPKTFIKIQWVPSGLTMFELLEIFTSTVSNKNLKLCKGLFQNSKGEFNVPRPKSIKGKRDYSPNYKIIEEINAELIKYRPTRPAEIQ